MAKPQFSGAITALITPFANGAVDEKKFQAFVDWQIEEGINGVVPCGTTGESPTLSHAEHNRVTALCVEVAKGRVPVIAGTGSNSTEEAISLTRHAQEAGADAALIVTPYYNKPTQAGMIAHYKAIHDATDIPIIIYNIPGRSVVDMTVATMAELAKLPRIAGVKDATNDLTRPVTTRLAIDADFVQLSGEDGTQVAYLGQGGHGCISVTANVAPRLCSAMHAAWKAGDFAKVQQINDRLMPLHEALFCESSPGPVKYAASLLGRADAGTRLPLIEIAASSKARVETAMKSAGLIN